LGQKACAFLVRRLDESLIKCIENSHNILFVSKGFSKALGPWNASFLVKSY
jgi:hypothetical protein